MPELLPTWEQLTALAAETGAPRERVARFLSLYRPAPYLSACSQAVWAGDEPVLVRNYDYSPDLWEGVLLHTRWNGRSVLAVSDCLWGVLDGINDAGLAVSLSFGGRRVVGDGFGIPLVLRYLLERCTTTAEAVQVLARVPSHMAYNVTVVDATGDFITAYLAPDRPPILRKWPLCTNHQEVQDWSEYTRASGSLEREGVLAQTLADPLLTAEGLVAGFRQPPLNSTDYARGFGTLYTAVYYPRRGVGRFFWNGEETTVAVGGG
jgi:predicted choloylglycine hydrolase